MAQVRVHFGGGPCRVDHPMRSLVPMSRVSKVSPKSGVSPSRLGNERWKRDKFTVVDEPGQPFRNTVRPPLGRSRPLAPARDLAATSMSQRTIEASRVEPPPILRQTFFMPYPIIEISELTQLVPTTCSLPVRRVSYRSRASAGPWRNGHSASCSRGNRRCGG